MSQANAMVQQAKALGLSLAQAQSQPYSNVQLPEEAQFIISTSMARLGLIPDAVTPDMIKDEERYTEELAKELGGFLTGTIGAGGGKGKRGMMDDRGLVGLDEIWGGWNRARGVGMSTRIYDDIIALLVCSPYSALVLHASTTQIVRPHRSDDQNADFQVWPQGAPYTVVCPQRI